MRHLEKGQHGFAKGLEILGVLFGEQVHSHGLGRAGQSVREGSESHGWRAAHQQLEAEEYEGDTREIRGRYRKDAHEEQYHDKGFEHLPT